MSGICDGITAMEDDEDNTRPTIPPDNSRVRDLLFTALPTTFALAEARKLQTPGWSAICEVLTGAAYSLHESHHFIHRASSTDAIVDRSDIQEFLRKRLLPEGSIDSDDLGNVIKRWHVGYYLNVALVSISAATNRILGQLVGDTTPTPFGNGHTRSHLEHVLETNSGPAIRSLASGIKRAITQPRFEPTLVFSLRGPALSKEVSEVENVHDITTLKDGEALGIVLTRACSFIGSFEGSAKARTKDSAFYEFEWNVALCALRDVSDLWSIGLGLCHPSPQEGIDLK